MSQMSRRAWLGMAGAAAAAGLVGLPQLQREVRAATLTPRELIRQRNLPNVVLTTHEGEQVRFYDDLVKDKFVTINMVYTSCKTTCPLTTANLVRVQKMLGDRVGRDLSMYSITLDPEHDTPEVLNSYVKTFGTATGITSLNGLSNEKGRGETSPARLRPPRDFAAVPHARRLRTTVCALLFAGISTSAPVRADTLGKVDDLSPDEARGRIIYTTGRSPSGRSLAFRLLGAGEGLLPAAGFFCANCHGPDGKGGREGNIVMADITYPTLTKPLSASPPWYKR